MYRNFSTVDKIYFARRALIGEERCQYPNFQSLTDNHNQNEQLEDHIDILNESCKKHSMKITTEKT